MHLFGIRVFEQQDVTTRQVQRQTGNRLRAIAAAMLTLTAGVPSGIAQQATTTLEPNKDASKLPAAPTPSVDGTAGSSASRRGTFQSHLVRLTWQPDQYVPGDNDCQGRFQ